MGILKAHSLNEGDMIVLIGPKKGANAHKK
jgi:hypothetical protein